MTRPGAVLLLLLILLILAPPVAGRADGGGPETSAKAEALVEKATGHWDKGELDEAAAALREAIAVEPKGETYRSLGWLYAERDRHAEAAAAFRSAIAADPSLEPELRLDLGRQLLFADRPAEAVPLIESAVAARPADAEARRLLSLAYRWTDRLADAERVSRGILSADPADHEARKGLAEAILWQGAFRAASREFERALEGNPSDPEALAGLARARMLLDLPEEADGFARRALALSPGDKDAREQAEKARERTRPHAAVEVRGSHDSDDLSIFLVDLSAYARAARGLDLRGSARRRVFRQGSPGKTVNRDDEDAAEGDSGMLSAEWRASRDVSLRAGAGLARYDAGGFRPWTASAGATVAPADGVGVSLDWERSLFDTILSFQERVTADAFVLSASKSFRWTTEVSASYGLVLHHNGNATGQPRENRGERAVLGITHPLYRKGDSVRVGGIARFGWLSFSHDLDVGVFDPRRYTTQEAGIDWRWEPARRWATYGTVLGGAQQEKGNKGDSTYSAEIGVDRAVGSGLLTLEGFSSDSGAGGRGGGFRRSGGLLRIRIPF